MFQNTNNQIGAAINRNEARRRKVAPVWRCFGPVRGACGVLHRSKDASERHCAKDARDCAAVRGYSDRRPQQTSRESMTNRAKSTIRVERSDIYDKTHAELWARFVGPLAPSQFAATAAASHRSALSATISAVADCESTGVLRFERPGLAGLLAASLASYLARRQWLSLRISAVQDRRTELVADAIVYRRRDDGTAAAWLQLTPGRVELCEAGQVVLVPISEWTVEEVLAGLLS